MTSPELNALSPVDGRYAAKLTALRELCSEAGLIGLRVRVEAHWLLHLKAQLQVPALRALPDKAVKQLEALSAATSPADAAAVKAIEARINHDVKAVEYFVREKLRDAGATPAQLEFVHFGCTSEDINNVCYALMLKQARDAQLLPAMGKLTEQLRSLAHAHAAAPMLARTHGQTASPTTMGKEIANVIVRLRRQHASLAGVEILGKFNGAVGNFNAHVSALPAADWPAIGRSFVESLGLTWNAYSTQIDPHDWIAEYCDALARFNTILIDLCRDIWAYISLGYFRQRTLAQEVGSSTMPHKVNPIDFENAEGNLGVANALLRHFAEKLPISRWQRDLTDSTVLRNVGVSLGHSMLALQAAMKGLGRLELDTARLAEDLDDAWEVLAEPIQTVMRAAGIPDGYEQLKAFSRGQAVDQAGVKAFIETLDVSAEDKKRLLQLTPASYIGLAAKFAKEV